MRRLAWPLVLALATSTTVVAQGKGKQGDVNVFLKGGVGGFTGNLGDYTRSGPTYGVTLNVQPFNVIGFELAYDGGRMGISDERIGDASILMNGGSAMVKLGLPFIERVKPFVAGGVGASYVTVNGETGGLYDSDLIENVPVAAGIEFNTGGLTAGVRGTWRMIIDEDFANAAQPVGDPEGNMLEGQVTLGGRF